MKKKIIAFVLVFCLLSSVITTIASTPFELAYSAGEYLFAVDASQCISASDITLSGSSVTIPANKAATYGFYLPFDARSVTIKYCGASGTTVLNSGYREYMMQLSGDGEYNLEFGTSLGYEAQNYYYIGEHSYVVREFTERKGEREFIIESTGGITIESLTFEKEKTPVPYSTSTGEKMSFYLPDVSESVFETVSTVMMDTKSPVIYVNGSRRYVDNNDTDAIPYNNHGTLYLPINTLAKALGYYCEDIPDKAYALLRNDNYEYTIVGGGASLSSNGVNPESVTYPAILYKDGQTWAAVRYFAELIGKTVEYKDGLVVIDDKYTVENILNDSDMLAYATGIFDDFKVNKNKSNVYYVAQTENASDLNDGSADAPFKTLAKAASEAEAGDTVIIKEGVYRETLSPQNSGTASNPITFRAADGDKVVISANKELIGFTRYKDNIYSVPMEWDMGIGKNQIFVNGKSMTEARYPNNPQWRSEGLSDLWPTKGDFKVSAENTAVISSDTLLNQDENDYWKGAYYVGAFGNSYALATGTIESSKNGEITVNDTSTKWWWTPADTDKWNYGCIIGHMNALDIANEWVKQGNSLYFIFPDEVKAEEAVVEAKERQLVIDLSGKKFINIEGIETIGGSVNMNNSEMCMLNGMNMKYISHYTLSNDQRDGYIDWPFNLKNEKGAPQRGEVGIYVGGRDNIIVNSRIDHSAGAGIYGTGLYAYIESNILNDCGYMGSYVSGITFDTVGTDEKTTARGGHSVFNNTVYNCGRSCLNIGQIEGVGHILAPYLPMEIAYNDFHDGMISTLDTGLIYQYYTYLGTDKKKTEIHHNYVYSTQSQEEENPNAFGIYHDGGSFGTETYSNLVFNTDESAEFSKYPIYQQAANHAPAYHAVYNNRALKKGIGTVDSLNSMHFPQGKMFYAGANPYSGDYLANYVKTKAGDLSSTHNVADAVLSDGVVFENGIAKFSTDGQYVCFENVDFGSGSDTVNLTVFGDKNYSCDEIEIFVGNSMDEVYPKTATIQVNSSEMDKPDNVDVNVGYNTGIQNVYIKVTDYRSLGIGSISVARLSERGLADSIYSAKRFAVDYTDCTPGRNTAPPSAVKYVNGEYTDYYLKDTWGTTILKYEKVKFNSDATNFVIAAGSTGDYTGQTVSVYLDSPEGTPIATYIVDKEEWTDFTPITVPLSKTVEQGVHTVYIKFENGYKTSNFYYFGFLPAGAAITQ